MPIAPKNILGDHTHHVTPHLIRGSLKVDVGMCTCTLASVAKSRAYTNDCGETASSRMQSFVAAAAEYQYTGAAREVPLQ